MSELNEKTKVPLGIAASFIVVVIGCTFWVNNTISGLQGNLKDLAYEIKALNTRLDALTADRWSGTDQVMWVEALKAKNPNLVVPDVNRR